MLTRILRALMPREEPFVAHFAAHAKCMVEAAAALQALMSADASGKTLCFDAICAIEGKADGIARETLLALHRAFLAPFDRSSIHALITAQDDALDLIEDVVQRAAMYGVTSYDSHMQEMGRLIGDCAALLAKAIPLMTDVSANAEAINCLCEQVGRRENEADQVLRQALSQLFREQPDAITLIARKETYELLEAVTDRCDDVADLIEGIVLDHV